MDCDLDDQTSQQFRVLCNRIEVELTAPSVILVTAATSRDGASCIAYRLSKAFSAAQRRTTLITSVSLSASETAHIPARARPTFAELGDTPSLIATETTEGNLQIIAFSQKQLSTISRTDLDALLSGLRLSNDCVVVDGGAIFDDTIGVVTAPCADGILVTFLSGRATVAADAALLDILSKCNGRLLGLVMTDSMALTHFKQRPLTLQDSESHRAPFALRLMRGFGVALRRLVKDLP